MQGTTKSLIQIRLTFRTLAFIHCDLRSLDSHIADSRNERTTLRDSIQLARLVKPDRRAAAQMRDRPAPARVAALHQPVARANVIFGGAGGRHSWWRRCTVSGSGKRKTQQAT